MLPKKLIVLLAFILLFLVLSSIADSTLLWDENAYLGNARSHLGQSNYTENFRFPLLEWLIVIFWIFGESIFMAKLMIILLSLGTVILVYLLSEKIFRKRAFLPVLIFAFSYPFLYWAFRIYTEIPMLFFILLSFYFLTEKKYHFAGLFAGLAFLAKFPAAIFALSAFLFLIYKKEYRGSAIFSGFFCIPLIPWLASNYIIHGNLLWDFVQQYKIVEIYTISEPAFIGIKNLFYSLGILILFLPVGIYSFCKNKPKFYELMLLFSFLTLIYVFFFVNIKYIRYFFGILPFLIFIAYDGAEFVKKKLNIRFLINVMIAISVIACFVLAAKDIAAEAKCSQNNVIQQSLDYLEPKVSQNDLIVSNYWPWLGYGLNVKVFSVWSDVDELLVYNPKYFVLHDRIGDQVNLKNSSEKLELENEITGKCGEKVLIYRVR